jgi:hypothetical protein
VRSVLAYRTSHGNIINENGSSKLLRFSIFPDIFLLFSFFKLSLVPENRFNFAKRKAAPHAAETNIVLFMDKHVNDLDTKILFGDKL